METRKHTKLLMARVDDQWQPKKDDHGAHYMRNLIRDLLNFMSESDVKEFCDQYGYEEETEEETKEETEEDSRLA